MDRCPERLTPTPVNGASREQASLVDRRLEESVRDQPVRGAEHATPLTGQRLQDVAFAAFSARPSATTSAARSTHASQMYTLGPATRRSTSAFDLPQKLHRFASNSVRFSSFTSTPGSLSAIAI